MKVTTCFFIMVTLAFGVSSILAQDPSSGEVFSTSSSYSITDVSDLEYRLSKMEDELKKKQDKTDTKKRFSVNVLGRIHFDSVNFSESQCRWGTGAPDQRNNIGLRDGRIGVRGERFDIFDYRVEIGFAEGNNVRNSTGTDGTTVGGVRLTDAFMGIKNVPGLDYVRVGHFEIEAGFAQAVSPRNITAMERAQATQMFGPGRRYGTGQTFLFADNRIRWFNGIFAARRMDNPTFMNDSNQGIIFNSRLTCVPIYEKDGTKFFHIGGHYMHYQNAQKNANGTYTDLGIPGIVRPGGFVRAQNWYTVAAINAPHYNQGGVEVAWSNGPLAFTAELFAGTFDKGRNIYGGYIEGRYFLTKDSRTYDRRSGAIGNVKTNRNLDFVKGAIRTHHHGTQEGFGVKSLGSWEVFFQWGFTDAERLWYVEGSPGGRTTDTVLGMNWYWNSNTRMMFEYVHSAGTRTNVFSATENIFAASFRFFF